MTGAIERPSPRQSWESDDAYADRIRMWNASGRAFGAPEYTPKEETPRANEGSVSETQQKETNMTTVIDTTAIDTLTEELRQPLPENVSFVVLDKHDPFFQETPREQVRAASALREHRLQELRDELARQPRARNYSWFVGLYDLTGKKLKSGAGDWDAMLEALPEGLGAPNRFRWTPNAVALHNDLIYVSYGQHLVTGVEVDADGEEQFSFISAEEDERRQDAEDKARWAPFVSAALASAPVWAKPVTHDDFGHGDDDDEYSFIYDGENQATDGVAHVAQLATISRTTKEITLGELEVVFYVDDRTQWTTASVRRLAEELSHFASYAEALGAKATDLEGVR